MGDALSLEVRGYPGAIRQGVDRIRSTALAGCKRFCVPWRSWRIKIARALRVRDGTMKKTCNTTTTLPVDILSIYNLQLAHNDPFFTPIRRMPTADPYTR